MLAIVAFVSATQGIQLSQFPWWEFDFAEMRREGVLYDGSAGGHKIHARSYRYASAVNVNAAWTNLENLTRSEKIGNAKELLPIARRLRQHFRFFAPELTQLGVDVKESQMRLGRVAVRLESELQEAPETTVRDLVQIKRSGWLVGFPDGLARPPIFWSRAKCARATLAAYQNVFGSDPQRMRKVIATQPGRNDISDAASGELAILKEDLPYLAPIFERLITEFGRELIDHNPKDLKRRIVTALAEVNRLRIPAPGEALIRFPDVPQGHWADEAVCNLRREGIFWGYPNGTFGTVGK